MINDKYPRSHNGSWKLIKTKECKGVTIGAGSTILPGLVVEKDAMVGAVAVIFHNILAGEVWVGNPAKRVGENPLNKIWRVTV